MGRRRNYTEEEIQLMYELDIKRNSKPQYKIEVVEKPALLIPPLEKKLIEEREKKQAEDPNKPKRRRGYPNPLDPEVVERIKKKRNYVHRPDITEEIRQKWMYVPDKIERIENLVASIEWTDEEMAQLNEARKKWGKKKEKRPARTWQEIQARSKELAKLTWTVYKKIPTTKALAGAPLKNVRYGPENFPDDPAQQIRMVVDSILFDSGLIVSVRNIRPYHYEAIAELMAKAGVHAVDFPSVNDMVNLNSDYHGRYRDNLGRTVFKMDQVLCVGAGDLSELRNLNTAEFSGVHFGSTTTVNLNYIHYFARYLKKTIIAGAYTPSEVHHSFAAGADFVKLFPMNCAGPEYVAAIHRNMPYIPLVAAGGVNADNIKDYFKAGADIVSVGEAIITPELWYARKKDQIVDNAKRIVDAVQEAKATVWKERRIQEKREDARDEIHG